MKVSLGFQWFKLMNEENIRKSGLVSRFQNYGEIIVEWLIVVILNADKSSICNMISGGFSVKFKPIFPKTLS